MGRKRIMSEARKMLRGLLYVASTLFLLYLIAKSLFVIHVACSDRVAQGVYVLSSGVITDEGIAGIGSVVHVDRDVVESIVKRYGAVFVNRSSLGDPAVLIVVVRRELCRNYKVAFGGASFGSMLPSALVGLAKMSGDIYSNGEIVGFFRVSVADLDRLPELSFLNKGDTDIENTVMWFMVEFVVGFALVLASIYYSSRR